MEIWLDTIDEDVITDGVKTGVLAGVTTNPSILSNAHNVLETLTRLLDIQSGPVAVQVTSSDPLAMVDEGMRIFELSSRFIIKVPINRNGLIAIKQLQSEKGPRHGHRRFISLSSAAGISLGVAISLPILAI